ncbi:RNA polymerase-binding protein DksA [Thermodesulfobacteriota bacterium]
MNQKDLKWFRRVLEESRDKILADAKEKLAEIPDGDSFNSADEMDFASHTEEQSFQCRLHDRNIKLLRKIEEALERIEEGEFGICEECEEAISIHRLKVRPMATLCIECKEEKEKRERNNVDSDYRSKRSIIHDWA